MDAEGAAALPLEEYDSGICVKAPSLDSTKANPCEDNESTPAEVTECAEEQGLDQAEGITGRAISEPNLAQTAETLDLSKHESCELGALKAGETSEKKDESEKSEKEKLSKDDLREDPSIEDSLGNLTAEDMTSENVTNENEEGKLRRQNASHRLVEGVRIPSESSSEQPR